MRYIIALLVALALNAVANLLMKTGADRFDGQGGLGEQGVIQLIKSNWVLLVGLTCFALNVFCYVYALSASFMKISFAYPIMVGGGYVIIAIVAWRFLGESMAITQWVGVGMILVGVCLVALKMDPAVAG